VLGVSSYKNSITTVNVRVNSEDGVRISQPLQRLGLAPPSRCGGSDNAVLPSQILQRHGAGDGNVLEAGVCGAWLAATPIPAFAVETLSIMTFAIVTFAIVTFAIVTFAIVTFAIVTGLQGNPGCAGAGLGIELSQNVLHVLVNGGGRSGRGSSRFPRRAFPP